MTLWRLHYLRAGKPSSCTFGAEDLIAAMEFYELWEAMNPGIKEISMQALGGSRFGKRLIGGAESIN